MYYIYEIWNPIDNTPIYVGYGKHDRKGRLHQRFEDHYYDSLKYKAGKIRNIRKLNMWKINIICQIIDLNLLPIYKFPVKDIADINEAYRFESELILKYGRRDLQTGPLTNLDSGGRGGRTWSQISKDKLSLTNSGRTSPTKGMTFGKYDSDRCDAISDSLSRFHENNPEFAGNKKGSFKPGQIPWNKGLKIR